MSRLLLFVVLAATLSLGSCQCSDKPDVGPVEEETASIEAVRVLGERSA